MNTNTIEMLAYEPSHRPALLNLLMELHGTYFIQTAPALLKEVSLEHNISKSYNEYVANTLDEGNEEWKCFLAKVEDALVGFIIGCIEIDEALLLNKTGHVEDWFVQPDMRGTGVGKKLYQRLEQWFSEQGCQQLRSEIWQGNDLSLKAHEKAGFEITGVIMRKKI